MTMVNTRVSRIGESATMAVDAKAARLKSEGKDIISLAAGQPDFPTPQHIKDAAIRAIEDNDTKYPPPDGTVALKNAVREKFRRENGLEYAPEDILVSCGAKHTLHAAMETLLEKNDEVIIPAPYWVSYSEQAAVCGGAVVLCETDEENRINADLIREKLTGRSKFLLLNSPSNPTGMVCPERELRKIADLALSEDLFVFSDEVYEHFLYGDAAQRSIASFSEEMKHRTLTINSVSKTYSMTGWRVGYCGGPAEITEAMARLQSHSANASSISQAAAVAALSGPQDSVTKMRDAFKERRDVMVKRLNELPGVACQTPDGAFYCFADISGTGKKSMDFCSEALDAAQVALVPGVAFGAEGFVRLSYAASLEQIERAMGRLGKWLSC